MSFDAETPFDLPILPPKIDLSDNIRLSNLLLKARTELAELKGYSYAMPNPMLLLSPAILRESLASSEIENINTTMEELLQQQLFSETERRQPNKEVLCYKDALFWGYDNINKYSISSRLILGVQKKLIHNSYGYRKQQNKIANSATVKSIYTPPMASELSRLMSNLENYLNASDDVDPLLKCAISHYQFESIHPFPDGNGRTGRILMVLYLVQEQLLTYPILYISGYINKNRNDYYKKLRAVTVNNNWLDFLEFMLQGFYQQAKYTKENLFAIMDLYNKTKEQLRINHKKLYSADLVDQLFSFPIITPVKLGKNLNIHYTTATRYLNGLVKAGFLEDVVQGKYHLYINQKLLKVINKE